MFMDVVILFSVLKIGGVIDWSWAWVVVPTFAFLFLASVVAIANATK